jgi:hypothetical protein
MMTVRGRSSITNQCDRRGVAFVTFVHSWWQQQEESSKRTRERMDWNTDSKSGDDDEAS